MAIKQNELSQDHTQPARERPVSAPGRQPVLDTEPRPWEAIQRGRQTGMQTAETVSCLAKALAGHQRCLLSRVSIPAEVVLHHALGVRYLNPLSMPAGSVASARRS